MKNPQTTVVMCSDESYIIPTYIALFSLLKNYRGTNELAVFILTRNNENFSKYMSLFQMLEGEFAFLQFRILSVGACFDEVKTNSAYISNATMYRLLIPQIVEVEKCIYLDSDLIVEEDISCLFDIDISGYCVAGVKDLTIAKNIQTRHSRFLGIPTTDYIQAGVLLMNLNEIRRLELDKELVFQGRNEDYPYNDQDILNRVFWGRIKTIDLRFNVVTVNINRNDNGLVKLYGMEKVKKAKERPVVIHYAGYRKPWVYKHMYCAKKWWKYIKMQNKQTAEEYIWPFLDKQSAPLSDQVKEKTECMVKNLGLYPVLKKVIKYL